MRRYMQGTLDYACGIYAVINALSCLASIGLAEARNIYLQSNLELANYPLAWKHFMRNETDHYFIVRYMLSRWCVSPPYALRVTQPFGEALLPDETARELDRASMYLPEIHQEHGPLSLSDARLESIQVWDSLHSWFCAGHVPRRPRAALLRFHRFIPGLAQPVVSHWTCVKAVRKGAVHLHDASSESGALHSLECSALLSDRQNRAMVRIVPESIVFLEAV